MHTPYKYLALALVIACATACSQQGSVSGADASRQSAGDTKPAPATPDAAASGNDSGDSPCHLLTDAEVRSVLPQAASGKRNTESLQYGLDRCAWETRTGRIGIEVSKVEASAFESELRSELQGFVDPRIQGALDKIVFQSVPGIGDHTIAVREKADAQRGILTDIALIAVQRGHRMAVLTVQDSSRNAALPTLDSLKDLARPMAARL